MMITPGRMEDMEILDSLILFEDNLLKNKKAKCPKCSNGVVKPVFPNHKEIWDYVCNECGYRVHFEKNTIID